MDKIRITILLLSACMLFSCSTKSNIEEAQRTLAIADSLHMEGIAYNDSAKLFKAVETLKHHRLLHPNDYARACYYYGRLLRGCGNQTAAMQAFIDGTQAEYLFRPIPHPSFSDHATMGRIYSNMGTLCHLADSFQLSYMMYERCAEQFEKANNTTAYYYAQNAMALELAEQRMQAETLHLLTTIRNECADTSVIAKTWETEGLFYKNIERYDSAIYAINMSQRFGNYEPTGYVTKARAFWAMEKYDSAVYYANYTIENLHLDDEYKYDMLYILAYNDPTVTEESVKQLTEERDDIYTENVAPEKQQLALAINLLKNSFNRTRYYINLLLVLFIIGILTATIWYATHRISEKKRKAYAEIAQEKEILIETTEREQQKQAELQQQQLQLQAEILNIQLHIADSEQKQRELHSKITEYNRLRSEQIKNLTNQIENNCNAIRHSHDWQKEIHWKDYDELCEFINQNFFQLANKLKATGILNEKEIRLCILVFLNCIEVQQMSTILNYAITAIRNYKQNVAKKFGIRSKDLRDFLIKMALSDYTNDDLT